MQRQHITSVTANEEVITHNDARVYYEPVGSHLSPDVAGEADRYKRYCQECGVARERDWKHDPECGQKLHWL